MCHKINSQDPGLRVPGLRVAEPSRMVPFPGSWVPDLMVPVPELGVPG